MDTFIEQLVPVRRSALSYLGTALLWLLAVLLSAAAVLLLATFGVLIGAGLIYGAYYLTGRFSVEYEYILTNGTLDVDRILAKRSRKRLLSFDVEKIERIERLRGGNRPSGSFSKTVMACSSNDPNAFAVTVSGKAGKVLLVMSPDDRTKQAMLHYLPKYFCDVFA